MASQKIMLGYWKIRCLVEPLRMMLHYAEMEFEDVLYECGNAPDFDRSCWYDVKFDHGLDFPNLPYLIDGDVKLTQTIPILHYLGMKTGLSPNDLSPRKIAYFDMLDHVCMDFILLGVDLCYSSPQEFTANKSATLEKGKEFIGQFSSALAGKHFFGGNKITGTDFLIFEALDRFERLEPGIIVQENMKKFMERVMALPTLRMYFSSNESSRMFPLNNMNAAFR